MQSYFAVPKNITLNSMHYFIVKIPIKQEIWQIVSNYSSSINFKDLMNLYKKCIAKQYSFLVIDTTLASDDFLRFLERI